MQSLNNSCFRKTRRNHLINGGNIKARLLFFYIYKIVISDKIFLNFLSRCEINHVGATTIFYVTRSKMFCYLTICNRLLFSEDLDSCPIVRGVIGRWKRLCMRAPSRYDAHTGRRRAEHASLPDISDDSACFIVSPTTTRLIMHREFVRGLHNM